MDNVLITEREFDKALFQTLVGTGDIKYIAAGGWSSADSLARSYLTDPQTRVVLVVDADTSDPNLVEDRKRFLRHSLGQIAQNTRWRVVVIAPETERLLFDNRSILEDLVQHKVTDTEFVEGQYSPNRVLQQLAGLSKMQLHERLAKINLDPIKKQPEIQDIRQFFGSKRRRGAA